MTLNVISQLVNVTANLMPLLKSASIEGFMKVPLYFDGHRSAWRTRT